MQFVLPALAREAVALDLPTFAENIQHVPRPTKNIRFALDLEITSSRAWS